MPDISRYLKKAKQMDAENGVVYTATPPTSANRSTYTPSQSGPDISSYLEKARAMDGGGYGTAPTVTSDRRPISDVPGAKKGFFDRLGLTVSGGAKGSLAGNMDAMGVAYEAGQSGRTKRDTAELKDAQWAVARAKHDYDADPSEVNKSALEIATTKMKAFADVLGEGAYEQALEAAYDAAAQFDTGDLEALYNSLGVVTPKTGTGVQQQAAKAARDLAVRVQDSARTFARQRMAHQSFGRWPLTPAHQ